MHSNFRVFQILAENENEAIRIARDKFNVSDKIIEK